MVYAGGGDWADIYMTGPGGVGVSAHGVLSQKFDNKMRAMENLCRV